MFKLQKIEKHSKLAHYSDKENALEKPKIVNNKKLLNEINCATKLSGFKFYLDIEPAVDISFLSQSIKEFGGEIAHFFSNEVTHLVTIKSVSSNQKRLPQGVESSSSTSKQILPNSSRLSFNSSQTPISHSCRVPLNDITPETESNAIIVPLSSHSLKCVNVLNSSQSSHLADLNSTPGSIVRLGDPTATFSSNLNVVMSRKSSIIPTNKHSENDLISKALKWKTTIWSVEELKSTLSIFYKEKSKIEGKNVLDLTSKIVKATNKTLKSKKLSECLNAEKRHAHNGALSGVVPGLAVTKAKSQQLKSTPQYSSSRLQPSQYYIFRHAYILLEDLLDLYRPVFKEFSPGGRGNNQVDVPTFYMNAAPGFCPFVTPSPSHFQHVQNKATVGNSKKFKRQALVVRPGVCECCGQKFSDADEHVLTKRHQAFIEDNSNWRKLDEMIAQLRRPLLPGAALKNNLSMISGESAENVFDQQISYDDEELPHTPRVARKRAAVDCSSDLKYSCCTVSRQSQRFRSMHFNSKSSLEEFHSLSDCENTPESMVSNDRSPSVRRLSHSKMTLDELSDHRNSCLEEVVMQQNNEKSAEPYEEDELELLMQSCDESTLDVNDESYQSENDYIPNDLQSKDNENSVVEILSEEAFDVDEYMKQLCNSVSQADLKKYRNLSIETYCSRLYDEFAFSSTSALSDGDTPIVQLLLNKSIDIK